MQKLTATTKKDARFEETGVSHGTRDSDRIGCSVPVPEKDMGIDAYLR